MTVGELIKVLDEFPVYCNIKAVVPNPSGLGVLSKKIVVCWDNEFPAPDEVLLEVEQNSP